MVRVVFMSDLRIQQLLEFHVTLQFKIIVQRFQGLAGLWFGVGAPALREFRMVFEVVQDFCLIEVVCAGRFGITVMLLDAASDGLQTGFRVGVC